MIKSKSRPGGWKIGLLITASALTLLFLYTIFGPKPTYADLAERVAYSVLEGDARGIEHLFAKEEMEAYKWDEDDLRRFFREYMRPRMAPFKVDKIFEKKIVGDSLAGTCFLQLTGPNGPGGLGVTVRAAPEGPQVSLRSLLTDVWANIMGPLPARPDPVEYQAALHRVMKHDQAELERLGFIGIYDNVVHPPKFYTFEQIFDRAAVKRPRSSLPIARE